MLHSQKDAALRTLPVRDIPISDLLVTWCLWKTLAGLSPVHCFLAETVLLVDCVCLDLVFHFQALTLSFRSGLSQNRFTWL